jgi:hypothetical protein
MACNANFEAFERNNWRKTNPFIHRHYLTTWVILPMGSILPAFIPWTAGTPDKPLRPREPRRQDLPPRFRDLVRMPTDRWLILLRLHRLNARFHTQDVILTNDGGEFLAHRV